mmetsp:Transcript_25219/g.60243  ORF Transcript_25219/g.60243 Transcript_25219/m.60243 type:complete len:287 (-) Transcript_25219:413-1273(-)
MLCRISFSCVSWTQKPKSAILTSPRVFTRMLSDLMSRCRRPIVCRKSTALRQGFMKPAIWASVISTFFFWNAWRMLVREPPSMSSITTQRQLSNMNVSRYSTTAGCAEVFIIAISFCSPGRSVSLPRLRRFKASFSPVFLFAPRKIVPMPPCPMLFFWMSYTELGSSRRNCTAIFASTDACLAVGSSGSMPFSIWKRSTSMIASPCAATSSFEMLACLRASSHPGGSPTNPVFVPGSTWTWYLCWKLNGDPMFIGAFSSSSSSGCAAARCCCCCGEDAPMPCFWRA